MVEERVQRRLAAILAADVVGYSRMMEADETGTLARLKEVRSEILDPTTRRFEGRIFKSVGDGALAEFASAVEAVQAALEIQRALAERNSRLPPEQQTHLRIGISLGDVIVEGDDLFGNGVNIAARMEGLADPGGVCISANIYEHARNSPSVTFEDLGEQLVKNIDRPIRCYRLRIATQMETGRSAKPALPEKPSIAVLPFQNMSGDPNQDYFADGVVEEIITALSRFHWLLVIARNSSFTYKGRTVDVKQVGRDLGVRYVLEGSVRKAADRVRITGQLIDSLTGGHLWADRFEGDLQNVFELQDQVTASVVGAIAPKLQQAEIERSRRKPTASLDAYDLFLRGMASFYRSTRESTEDALQRCYEAVRLDPGFATPHGLAATCYAWRQTNGWVVDRAGEIAETARLARHVWDIGRNDAVALAMAGLALGQFVGELEDGAAMVDRALELNPNLAIAWLNSGALRLYLGEPEKAVQHLERAMRLSPLDPQMYIARGGLAVAHLIARRYDEAASLAERALLEQPNWAGALRTAAASHALAGRIDRAREFMARLRKLDPSLRISTVKSVIPARKPDQLAEYLEALRSAGLPE